MSYFKRLDARVVDHASGDGAGTGDFTSGTFTSLAGSLLVAVVTVDNQNGATYDETPTPTTSGTTWIQVASAGDAGTSGQYSAHAHIYMADSPGAGSSNTFAMAGTGQWDTDINSIDLCILEFPYALPVVQQTSLAFNETHSSSGVGRDPGALSIALSAAPAVTSYTLTALAGDGGDSTTTPGTGFNEITDRLETVAGAGTFLKTAIQLRIPGSTSTQAGWVGGDVSTNASVYDYSVAAVEIKASFNIIATDDFNRADGGLGANWSTIVEAPTIISNAVKGASAGTAYRAGYNTAIGDGSSPIWVEATLDPNGASSYSGVLLSESASSYNDSYSAVFGSDDLIYLTRRVAGVDVDVATAAWTAGIGPYRVRLEWLTGRICVVYLDGVEVIRYTDANTNVNPTHAGFSLYTGNLPLDTIDNFSAGDWSEPVSITDYLVQYRTTSGPGAWQTFTDGVSDTTGATVTGLSPGVSYDFRVAAINSAGTGLWSNVATVTAGSSGVVNLKLGDTSISAIKLGDTSITKAYLGDTLVVG